MAYSSVKRPKSPTDLEAPADREGKQQQLLPGLPDHLAHLCLRHVQPSLLYSVCHRWRRLVYSTSYPPFMSLYCLLSNPLNHDGPEIAFYCYDPIAAVWSAFPSPINRRILLRHPSFIARALPVQSVTACSQLILLAATTHKLLPAIPSPLVFDPATRKWRHGPKFSSPRRWCVAGDAGGHVYLASGVGREYNAEVARSMERWDVKNQGADWETVAALKDGRFSREAVGAVTVNGKMYMVNMQGGAGPRDGAVYDLESDQWEEMPAGMVAGWTGPAAAEKSSSIYTVDEGLGALRAYDMKMDCWRTVATSERLKDVTGIAAGGRRICVACSGGDTIAVFDLTSRKRRMWVVQPPAGKRVIALHVLPRMSSPDSP